MSVQRQVDEHKIDCGDRTEISELALACKDAASLNLELLWLENSSLNCRSCHGDPRRVRALPGGSF